MTLLFAHIAPEATIIAADQRLTLAGTGRVWDEQSSKLVAILCTDGLAVIGYTGVAYVRNLPTDEYIARLAIDLLAPGTLVRGVAIIGLKRVPIRVGTTLKKLIERLHAQIRQSKAEFSLVIAGQRRFKKRMWPFVALIDHLERGVSYPAMRKSSVATRRWAIAGDSGNPGQLFARYEREVAFVRSVLPNRHSIEHSIRAIRTVFEERQRSTSTIGDSIHFAVISQGELRLGMWAGPSWRDPGIVAPAYPGSSLPPEFVKMRADIYSPWVVASDIIMPPSLTNGGEIRTGTWHWNIVISEIMSGTARPPIDGLSGIQFGRPSGAGWGPAKRRRAP
jgi:hypothetical protein